VCCIWKSLITKGISKSNAFIIIRHPGENQLIKNINYIVYVGENGFFGATNEKLIHLDHLK
jgi:hypothetical protein